MAKYIERNSVNFEISHPNTDSIRLIRIWFGRYIASINGKQQASIRLTEEVAYESAGGAGPGRSARGPVSRILWGEHGLRVGWSVLLFLGIYALLSTSADMAIAVFLPAKTGPLSLQSALLQEGSGLAAVLLASAVLARVEGKRIAAYGFGGDRIGLRALWGLLSGIVCLSGLVGVMWGAGMLTFGGEEQHGLAALLYGIGWAAACGLTGLYEEALLRGYLQNRLARSFGFWPAAVVLSAAFGLWHLTNDAESALGLFVAAAGGFIFCISLWYTGSLWWAIGFHAGWDWAQGFLFGLPDSGIALQGTFLNMHASGNPAWSGGATGPEGSLLMLPVLILLALGMHGWWSRSVRFRRPIASIRESEGNGSSLH
jgi:membrane protease YdiL (CAAX protease family)